MSTILVKGGMARERIQKILQQDEQHLVRSFADRNTYLNSRDRCIVCGSERAFDIETRMIEPLVGHHVKYFPPVIAWVHYRCHKKIHDTDNPLVPFIQYSDGDSRKYYEAKNR